MNIRDLIDSLENYAERYGDGCEVKLQTQQAWPFINFISGVCSASEVAAAAAASGGEPDEPECHAGAEDGVSEDIFLVEGGQEGYGNSAAWEACG